MTPSKKILIIEDEKTLAKALELKLTHSGFDVRVVFNGEDGISILSKESFDMILLDLIMPKIDGFAVLSELKNRNIKTPVFVLSNLSHGNDSKRTKQFGAKEFFIKSNTPISHIVSKVVDLLK